MSNTGGGQGTPVSPPSALVVYEPDRSAPLLPLDEWARIMGFNPWHFRGMGSQAVPYETSCNPLVFQYAWQNSDAVGRAEVSEAILSAESKLHEALGFAVAPQFESDVIPFPKFNDARQNYVRSVDARGRYNNLRTMRGYVRAMGVEKLELIATANVSYSDADSDAVVETFTLTAATSETDPDNIAVYFVAADRVGDVALAGRWRVQPISVVFSAGTATIRGKRWSVVKPALYEGMNRVAIDPADDAKFVTQLMVYRRTVDDTQHGALVRENAPADCCDGGDPAGTASQTARFGVRDGRLGLIYGEAVTYDATGQAWHAAAWPCGAMPPEKATVNYYAGWPLERGQMAERMKLMVARLAAAELARPVCGCDTANKELTHWQFDVSKVAGGDADELYQSSLRDLDECPWGMRRGHVYAWREAQKMMMQRAISSA